MENIIYRNQWLDIWVLNDVAVYMYPCICRFLELFDLNKGSGKDALKFAKSFQISVEHQDVTTIGQNSNTLTIARVLELGGLPYSSFPDPEEAKKCAVHMCKKNALLMEYTFQEPEWDTTFPHLSTVFYIESKGKDTSAQQVTSKKLTGNAALQTTAQISDANIFLEGQGFQEDLAIAEGVQVVNVKKEEIEKKLASLQLTCQFWC